MNAPYRNNINSESDPTENYSSTLFTVVQVDDYNIYSLEGPSQIADGVQRASNEALNLKIGNEYKSFVAAEGCEVFYIDEKDAVSENTVPSVTDRDRITVQFFTDDTNKLVCVVIDEQPQS